MNQLAHGMMSAPYFGLAQEQDQKPMVDRLERLLQSQLGGCVSELRLEVRSQGLILHGNSHTYYAKQLAQHAVMEATDLPLLANAIVVG